MPLFKSCAYATPVLLKIPKTSKLHIHHSENKTQVDSMNKVLLIAYHFPPLSGGGVFRTLKFTKYLPEFGYQPHVLTVKNPMYRTKDATLLIEIPPEAKVYRTFSFEHMSLRAPRLLGVNLKWCYIPDENVGWLPSAVRRGEEIIKKENIDLVYATAPMFTSFLIGFMLKKKTGKPLVLDYRDPWTQNVFVKYPSKFHKKIEEKLETFVLATADHIIVTAEPMKRKLVEKYPFTKGKIDTITNGFDSEDFKNLTVKKDKEKFVIVYAGSLYGQRTGEKFFAALKKLIEKNPELQTKIEVLFAGLPGKQAVFLVEKFELEKVVKLLGYKSHQESLTLMANADVLLLIMSSDEVNDAKIGTLTIPGKVFEYLGAKRPILAIVPRGPAADIINSTKTGVIVPPQNTDVIARAIFKLFQEWKSGTLEIVESDVSEYDRKALTQKLAKVFQQVQVK
jgi:glycosyltransferase involved in cell wall biosynthesis